MKYKPLVKLGKRLMRLKSLRICIVDDQEAYFTPRMLAAAKAVGYERLERYSVVNDVLLRRWLEDAPDIVILDIKGVATPDVAKDGFGIAEQLRKHTNAYVVITSAHQYHLKNVHLICDYVLENRLLTVVDFLAELDEIVRDCQSRRLRFYRKLSFRAGRALVKGATLQPPAT